MSGVLVSHAMTRDPISAKETSTLAEIAGLMRKHRISGLPVIANSGKVVGVVSHKDVARAVRLVSAAGSPPPPEGWPLDGDWKPSHEQEAFLRQGKVGRVMTPDPVVISHDAPLDLAAGIMEERRIGRLPVMDGGKLVGIITRHDVFSALGRQG